MTDTVKTIKSAGGDYSSLGSWEAGQQKSITAGDNEIAECYTFQNSISSALDIDGWTTLANAKIIIRTPLAERHTGVLGTGFRVVSSNSYYGIRIFEDYVELDGIAIHNSTTGTDNGARALSGAIGAGVKVKNCLLTKAKNTGTLAAVYVTATGGASTWIFENTTIIGPSGLQAESSYPVVHTYNCDLIGVSGYGLYLGYVGNCKHKNAYMHGATNPYRVANAGTITFTTCLHSNTQTITGSTGSIAYSTANFTNVTQGSEDLKLIAGSALIDVATDLTSDADNPFSTDFMNTTRSGSWDVGFNEFIAAASRRIYMIN